MKTLNDIRSAYRTSGMEHVSDSDLLRLCGIRNIESLSDIFSASASDGLTSSELEKVSVLKEVVRRSNIYSLASNRLQTISSSQDAFDILSPMTSNLEHEEAWCLFLNRANRAIACRKMTSGGIDSCIIDVRLILRTALSLNAVGIILSHNHPSGNFMPSSMDIKMTKHLRDAASQMDIRLLDHIVIASGSYYSFADEGTL